MWRGHPREVPCASDTLVRRLDVVGIAIGCPVERSSTSPLSQRPESVQSLRFARAFAQNAKGWSNLHGLNGMLDTAADAEVIGRRLREPSLQVARTFSTLMAETWLAARCIGVLEDPPERSRRAPPHVWR